MAKQLGVDLGIMIGVGCLIGFPAMMAGLIASAILNRRMPIPMRALPGEASVRVGAITGPPSAEHVAAIAAALHTVMQGPFRIVEIKPETSERG